MNACYNNKMNVYTPAERYESKCHSEKSVGLWAIIISVIEAIFSNTAIVSVLKTVAAIACVGFFALTVSMVLNSVISFVLGAVICLGLFAAVGLIFAGDLSEEQ